MMTNSRFKQFSAVFLISLILIAYYYLSNPDAPFVRADTPGFQAVAVDLLENGRLDEFSKRPIGYPILLILTGAYESPTRFLFAFQLVLHSISVTTLFFALKLLKVNYIFSLLFFVFAWLPPSVSHTTSMLVESLSALCLALGVGAIFFYLNKGSFVWAIVAGISLSYAAIIAATFQLLVPSIVFVIALAHFLFGFLRDNRARIALLIFLLLMPYTLIVGGYIGHNLIRFDAASIEPSTGLRLFTRTVRFVQYLPDEYAVEREILVRQRNIRLINPNRYELHTATQYIWTDGTIPDLLSATGLSYEDLSNRMLIANLKLISNYPLEYLRDVAASMATFWFPLTGTSESIFNTRIGTLFWTITHFLFVIIYMLSFFVSVLALCAILALANKYKFSHLRNFIIINSQSIILIALISVIVIQVAMVSTMFEIGDPRYRIPLSLLLYSVTVIQISIIFSAIKNVSDLMGQLSSPRIDRQSRFAEDSIE